jgi:phosphoenolpyruvate carboxylase
VGFDATLLRAPEQLPRFSLSTWVGGDRDGHPLVTPELTRQTLEDLQIHGLLLLQHELAELAVR